MVCDKTVAMVRVDELELVFLIQYRRPGQPVASGNVIVVAEVPVNAKVLSLVAALVAEENDLKLEENDPRTSSVEFGVVVPIPTWAPAVITRNKANDSKS